MTQVSTDSPRYEAVGRDMANRVLNHITAVIAPPAPTLAGLVSMALSVSACCSIILIIILLPIKENYFRNDLIKYLTFLRDSV